MRNTASKTLPRTTSLLRVALAGLVAYGAIGCGALVDDTAEGGEALRLSNPPGLTMTVCGRVTGYDPPRNGLDGELRLDRGTWTLLNAAPIANETLLRVERRVCVHATLDLDQRIQAAYILDANDPRTDELREIYSGVEIPAMVDAEMPQPGVGEGR